MEVGVIRPSKSPWASRLLVVKKADGTCRACVDYRRLNKLAIRDCYPLPVIDDVHQRVSKGKIFAQTDLYARFWQLGVNEKDIQNTACVSPLGNFRNFYLKNEVVIQAFFEI